MYKKESFCLINQSTNYEKRQKCNLNSSRIDLGKWKFSVNCNVKVIGYCYYSVKVNQSILNIILRLDLTSIMKLNQIKSCIYLITIFNKY